MEFQRSARKSVTVPIVSLIDILTILLIFFIVTTTFKEPRPAIDIEIPVASGGLVSELADKRSTLTVSNKGQIFIDAVEVLPGELPKYLESFLTINPGRKLELKIDEGCPFGTMVSVWEALTEAGIGLKDVPHRVQVPEPSQ